MSLTVEFVFDYNEMNYFVQLEETYLILIQNFIKSAEMRFTKFVPQITRLCTGNSIYVGVRASTTPITRLRIL